MKDTVIVNTRKEFQELLRKEFIPYLTSNNMSCSLPEFQSLGMFHKWTMFFYEGNCIELVENKSPTT